MKKIATAILLFIGLNTIGQTKFEKGYYIDNQGIKIKGFINNEDWLNNPKSFKFKSNLTSKTLLKNIESIREFGIHGKIKYVKATVNIDRSSSKVGKLSSLRTSEFKEEKLLLKVLVEGSANLYSYTENDLNRYFYKKDESIKPLEYKLYITSSGSIAKNRNYLFELKNKLTCKNLSSKGVNYTKSSLVKYFINFNDCVEHKSTKNYTKSNNEKKLHLRSKIGINFSKGRISRIPGFNNDKMFFDSETGLVFGAEIEFLLPIKNNKWALFLEPIYRSYNAEKKLLDDFDLTTPGDIYKNTVLKYSSIELSIGAKHYFYLKNKSNIFFNTALISDFPLRSSVYVEGKRNNFDIEKTEINLMIGMGTSIYKKYSIEFRYYTNRDILATYSGWDSNFNSFSILFGYQLF